MKWHVEFTRESRKDLRRITVKDRERIFSFLNDRVASKDDPRELAKRLSGDGRFWRYRVGSYRIIVEFEDDRLVVVVVEVSQRGDIYKSKSRTRK
jgi:mRNA interferase RelE/StbE